jgi:uncharacterized delta-60 repeat protein
VSHVPFRHLALALFAGLPVFGCDSFDSNVPPASPGSADGGTAPVEGDPESPRVGIDATSLPLLVVGEKVKVPISITRNGALASAQVAVTVSVRSDPRLSADPIVIPVKESAGVIEITVTPNTPQGPIEVILDVNAAARAKAEKKLAMFVRGRPGDLDTTFGEAGAVHVGLGADLIVRGMAVNPNDGKITILGECAQPNTLCMARLTADGVLDKTFGTDGKVARLYDLGKPLSITGLPEGKLLIGAGNALSRLTATGAIDATFGPDASGRVVLNLINETAFGLFTVVEVAKDGTIALGFNCKKSNVPYTCVARMTASGAPIGDNGGVSTHQFLGTATYSIGYTFGPSGELVGGAVQRGGGSVSGKAFAFQLTAANALDTSFASPNGYVSGSVFQLAEADINRHHVRRLADGRTVIAGAVLATLANFAVLTFLPNGTGLDTSWGTNGTYSSYGGFPAGMVIDADGSVVVGLTDDLTLARLDAKGQPDGRFGQFGKRSYNNLAPAFVSDVAAQSDGRYVVLGLEGTAPDQKAVVFRVWH